MTDQQPTERITGQITGQTAARLDTAGLDPVQARPRRPFPVWPVIVAVLAVSLLAVIVVLFVTADRRSGVTVAPVATSPTPSPTPGVAAPAPAPAPRPEASPNQCVDALGDAGTVDLDTVTLAMDDDELTVRFELVGALPPGESGLGVVAERHNRKGTYQLSIGFLDGRLERFFIWDGDDEDELDLDDVRLDGTAIVAVFPQDELDRLGNSWRWRAFGTAAGSELDACPGGDDLLEYEDRGR